MNNRFFDIALNQAARLAGKKDQDIGSSDEAWLKNEKRQLVARRTPACKGQIFTIGRLAKAYATGKYRSVSWKAMLILCRCYLFVNPLDLIPDLIPVAGFTDDFAILVWVYNSIRRTRSTNSWSGRHPRHVRYEDSSDRR
jgi:uncharacterized membrane protein YkvA (DUF1232 family)